MGEEEVNLTCLVKYLCNRLNLISIKVWVQIQAAQLWNKKFEVSSCEGRACKVRVQADADQQVRGVTPVAIQLDKGVEYLTIDESLLFKCLECVTEILYDAAASFILTSKRSNDATTEQIVRKPENRPHQRDAPEVLLVHLFHRDD